MTTTPLGVTAIATDIETIPSQLPWVKDYVASNVKHPGNITKPESIEKWYEEKHDAAVQDALAKCSLDGAMNHIICIGFMGGDGVPHSFYARDPVKDEAKIITDYFNAVISIYGDYAHEWVGHNISGFDFRILRQRCIVLGIQYPAIFYRAFNDKWGDAVFDTMLRWSNDKRDCISLEKLCLALGAETPKAQMDGSQVYDFWKAGRHDEIRAYCEGDVVATYEVYKRMKGIK